MSLGPEDILYYSKRVMDEREAARRARHPGAASAHDALAAHYVTILEGAYRGRDVSGEHGSAGNDQGKPHRAAQPLPVGNELLDGNDDRESDNPDEVHDPADEE